MQAKLFKLRGTYGLCWLAPYETNTFINRMVFILTQHIERYSKSSSVLTLHSLPQRCVPNVNQTRGRLNDDLYSNQLPGHHAHKDKCQCHDLSFISATMLVHRQICTKLLPKNAY